MLLQTVEVLTILLVAVAMALSLAHVLELPGKMRLSTENYLATQAIYYPGFTVGGIAEPLGLAALVALLLLVPGGSTAFWLILLALIALVALHAVFWVWVQPVNRIWLKDMRLNKAGSQFFGIGKQTDKPPEAENWERLRNQWEYGHAARAGLGLLSLILLVVAITG